MAVQLTTRPVRGKRLEPILTEGCEIDEQVDAARESPGDGLAMIEHGFASYGGPRTEAGGLQGGLHDALETA